MDVGSEFVSWDSFQQTLDLYASQHKVAYVLGTHKSVEDANKCESLLLKFPAKFKFCFARLVCQPKKTPGLVQGHSSRSPPTACLSSILVMVNKKRTMLVVKEANFQHSHDASSNKLVQDNRTQILKPEECLMTSVLSKCGAARNWVQQFLHDFASNKASFSDNVETDFKFLANIDQLMVQDPAVIIELIHVNQAPRAVYIQTSEMTRRMSLLNEGYLQIVSFAMNDEMTWLISVLGIDSHFDYHNLAFCIILNDVESSFQNFLELFFKNNTSFCDSLKGVVVDCSKDNVEFLLRVFPQSSVAWSRSHILQLFAQEVKTSGKDVHRNMQIREAIMNAASEEVYEKKLKELIDVFPSSESKEFLRSWDAYKELWALHEISQKEDLPHQKCAIEREYYSVLDKYVSSSITVADLVAAVGRLDKDVKSEESEKEIRCFGVDASCQQYRLLCTPAAAEAVVGQISIAMASQYVIKEQADMIFVKRRDTEEEFILDISGQKCTCQFFLETDLPCQHVLAYLKTFNKSLYDDTLISAIYQVFGHSWTLDNLEEKISQGCEPSAMQYQLRITELKIILRDILLSCCSHSHEQMGKDLILLKQVYNILKSNQSNKVKLPVSEESTASESQGLIQDMVSSSELVPRKRGRPRKKNRQEPEPQYNKCLTPEPVRQVLLPPPTQVRHNLRTNIKHKFVTRDIQVADQDSRSSEKSHISEVSERTKEIIVSLPAASDNESRETTATTTQIVPLNSPNAQLVKNNFIISDTGGGEINEKTPLNDNSTLVIMERNSCQNSNDVSIPSNGSIANSGVKRTFSDCGLSDGSNDEYKDEDVNTEEDESGVTDEESSDEEEVGFERRRKKRMKTIKDIENFLSDLSGDLINEVLESSSLCDISPANTDSGEAGNGKSLTPADAVINACQNKAEYIDAFMAYLVRSQPDHSQYTHRVAACVLYQAFYNRTSCQDILKSLSTWPAHLVPPPPDRTVTAEVILAPEQILSVCGHKLNQTDMETLVGEQEISPKVLHAYLELLAQKHSGRLFVIPFDVILQWRSGNFSQTIFKKVHFKTFDYLVLPICCGGEFSDAERKAGDIINPCWMALVADMKQRTVSVMSPRSEDKYIIAANGYMLQWRRYMQIRSVNTGEMLSSWTSRHIPSSKMDKSTSSGTFLLMNVEALINNVPPVVMTEAHIANFRLYVAVALRDSDRESTVLCVGGPDCQLLAARDADWLQCQNCRSWWHQVCNRHLDLKCPFYCTPCQQRMSMVGASLTIGESLEPQAESEALACAAELDLKS